MEPAADPNTIKGTLDSIGWLRDRKTSKYRPSTFPLYTSRKYLWTATDDRALSHANSKFK